MDQQFSWDGHLQTGFGSLSNTMVLTSDHQPTLLDSGSFSWPQDDQAAWSASSACPQKRLKLEERLQGVLEKADDAAFQPFYLTSCFQPPGDPNKDISGFSYLPQSYLCKQFQILFNNKVRLYLNCDVLIVCSYLSIAL